MAAVKSLVVFMGGLLVLGLGLLSYGMIQQSEQMRQRQDEREAMFGPVALDEPEGTRIATMRTDGAGRLLLGLSGGGRPDRVAVVDLADGRHLGTVLVTGPADR